MKKLFLFVSLFLLFSTPVFCQEEAYIKGKLSPFTAYFISQLQDSAQASDVVQKRFGVKRQSHQQTYVEAFVELNENASLKPLKKLGVEVNMVLDNIITTRIPAEKIEAVSLLPEVKRVEIGIPVQKRLNKARPAGRVDLVQAGTELADVPYKGKDVVIGIIDGGFQYNHANFYSSGNNEFRIKRVWDQNATDGTPPSGYSSGTEYKTKTEIINKKYDTTAETHGMHVAGIAAGSDTSNGNPYYGVAPEADIVLVSYDIDDDIRTNVSISNAIGYIYNYAESENKPAVVNLSLGVHIGPHDGTSAFDKACDKLQGEGKLLVGAAGNEGGDALHISKAFTRQDTLKTFISFFDDTYYGLTDIWSDKHKSFSVQLVTYNRLTGEEVFITKVHNSSISEFEKYSLSSITGDNEDAITIYTTNTAYNSNNSRSNVLIVTDINRPIPSNLYLGLKIIASSGTVHAWADDINSYFSGNGIAGWLDGSSSNSIGEIGGTGKQIISVGAYTTSKTFKSIDGGTYGTNQKLDDITSFSSLGPTLDGRMKPDITAPGSIIVSSYSDTVANDDISVIALKNNNSYYGVMQGTSMAAPYVTGVLATWLQAKNNLTPKEVRAIFQETAINDKYTGDVLSSGSNTWGYGKIDAWEGIKKCLKLKQQEEGGTLSDIEVRNVLGSKELELVVVNEDAEDIQALIYDINGQLVMQTKIPSGIGTHTLDVSEVAVGIFIVSFTGKNLNAKPQRIIIL